MSSPLTLSESDIIALLRDPVLAARIIFNIDLDVHQRVMLRYMWFGLETHIDSGIFQGKTLVGWIWCNLQAILIPSPPGHDPRIIVAFYQDMGSANTVFKPYFEKFIGTCPIYRAELQRQRGGVLGYRPVGGGWEYQFRNGNSILVPAIGLKEDAEKMASLRVHAGMVEEAKSIEKKSDSLDNQLLSRINADCWNPAHPVFANSKVLMGHAEDPATHPAYRRHKAAKQAIKDGDQTVVIMTSNFRDWTLKFLKFRKDKEIRTAKRTMSPAKFAQRYGGLWEYGTEDWYEPKVLDKCRSFKAHVLIRRDVMEAIFALGQDTAVGENRRSDWNATVIWRALLIPNRVHIPDTTGLYIANGERWSISPCWAWQGKGRDGGQLSGIVHRGHQNFSFSRVVYDPGGGGLWVAKEYWKPQQFFDGKMHNVTGLCRPEDVGLYPQASPILLKWSKGSSDLAHAFEEKRFLSTDDGIIEAIHLKTQEMFYGQQLLIPPAPEDWPAKALALLSREERESLTYINTMMQQFVRIKVETITKNGEEVPRLSRSGFRSFRATGKKDLAYAGIYGLAGILSVIHDPDLRYAAGEDGECCAIG